MTSLFWSCPIVWCVVCPIASADGNGVEEARGKPETLTHEYGAYVRYVPKEEPAGLLVLVHGSLGADGSATAAAETFVERWTELAARRKLVIIAPAFDQENFGGVAGPGGGYRGLFGRHVGADVFLNALVDATRESFPELPQKFHLYGHSAGGQFVSRYLAVHPERVASAVISAAGSFAFPDPDTPWTNGMGRLKRRMRWSDDAPWQEIDIQPDPRNWLAMAQLPVVAVVGSNDTGDVKESPGNPGRNHVERARHWVVAMRKLAHEHGKPPRVRYVGVAGVGHNSRELTPACQSALFDEPAP